MSERLPVAVGPELRAHAGVLSGATAVPSRS